MVGDGSVRREVGGGIWFLGGEGEGVVCGVGGGEGRGRRGRGEWVVRNGVGEYEVGGVGPGCGVCGDGAVEEMDVEGAEEGGSVGGDGG